MNSNKEKGHATKISQQLHKNYIFQRGPDTIQQVAPVPARGYITYSSHESIDHSGDGQWQTQRRYGSSTEGIMPKDHRHSCNYYANSGNAHPKANEPRSDYFGSYHDQANYSSNYYRGDDPVFDEFLRSLMESFEGYNNANVIGYRPEFGPPVGYYNDPNFTNIRNNHSAHIREKIARPDSPSARAAMSVGPENDPWLPGPRPSAGQYPEHQYAQPRFGPFDRTQFNYPDSSLRMSNAHPRTEWSDVPGNQRSEFFPRQNMRYSDHQYAPHDHNNQTQSPNTPPQRNSPRPVLSTRFEEGKLPNAGGYGHSPSGEVDSFRNSPKEGYNYSYAPPAPMAPRDSMTNPETETSWDIKVTSQPNTAEKISNMTTGALNFAKKNLYPVPEMANRWQFSNQPRLGEKSANTGSFDLANTSQYKVPPTEGEGNTRPEFSPSQGKGTAFPEMAKSWLSNQINTGEKNPNNGTLDFSQPTQFPSPASQETRNTRPEYSKSASRGKGTAFPEMAKSWFNKQSNTGEKNPHDETLDLPDPNQFHTPASQEVGNTRPEFSKSASRVKGTAFPEMAKSWFSKQSNTGEKNPHAETLDLPDTSQFHTPASQDVGNTHPEFFRSSSKGNARPEMENSWEIANQPNNGETYSNATVQDSSRGSQVLPDSQKRGNGIPEASNGSEISKQQNNMGKFSKLGAMSPAKKSQFPSLFSKEK